MRWPNAKQLGHGKVKEDVISALTGDRDPRLFDRGEDFFARETALNLEFTLRDLACPHQRCLVELEFLATRRTALNHPRRQKVQHPK